MVLTSLGDGETAGSDLGFPDALRSRWTELLYRDALPTRAIHIDLGEVDQSVADGVATQLRTAEEARPTIATVWFATFDQMNGTAPDRYEADLTTIVQGLKQAGAKVFVATNTGTRYDAAIARVVKTEKVTGVSIGGLTSPLGKAGHAEVAKRFARAIGKVP